MLTTYLEAVNTVLQSLGFPPINSLSGEKTADVASAEHLINSVSREVQSIGWNFNSESKYKLVVDNDGFLNVPPNVVRCDFNTDDHLTLAEALALRGTRVYDRANHTYTFEVGKAYSCDVVFVLSWDELPEPARAYIAALAARKAASSLIGEADMVRYTQADVQRRFTQLQQFDGEQADLNIMRNYDVIRVIARDGVRY